MGVTERLFADLALHSILLAIYVDGFSYRSLIVERGIDRHLLNAGFLARWAGKAHSDSKPILMLHNGANYTPSSKSLSVDVVWVSDCLGRWYSRQLGLDVQR